MQISRINPNNVSGSQALAALPFDLQVQELVQRIEQFTKYEGFTDTAIDAVQLIRADHPTTGTLTVYEPSVCIIAQGQKQAVLGNEILRYDPANYLVASVDVPVMGQVLEATPEKPYLCFRLALDTQQISYLLLAGGDEIRKTASIKAPPRRGLFVSKANATLLDAVLRLMRLLETPADIPVLAPLLMREIIYRLLQGEQGETLAQIALAGSHAQQIGKVINTLKRDYHKNLRIDDLAREACMSSSSLHAHFKTITNMTPLQYQKQLRLQEARRLLFAEQLDAATVSHRVGYESPSQFNREYHRLFGLPPVRDIARLRSSNALFGQA
ncbi:AraC family transcriptional regulator [Cellvibrio fibrivorans]|uniref:AraC-like DNA-binding protein n=1 Tax=Cellvibrio fibrivorans TaxID=126350 RepID=A0ABU1UTB7_9GAMM|nr:AraC family transcriptional regulator [Cellvibrio fibrivorans]MDR7088418.1 AraC-like DNA-binding protein [Cellvibrio fibrivorans]